MYYDKLLILNPFNLNVNIYKIVEILNFTCTVVSQLVIDCIKTVIQLFSSFSILYYGTELLIMMVQTLA